MIILAVIALSTVIAILRGGRISHLGELGFRHSYLVLLGAILQLAIFFPWWSRPDDQLIAILYPLSLVIILVAVMLNYRLPGISVLGFGLLCNLLVISVNGGYMPASREALIRAGLWRALDVVERGGVYANSVLMGEGTRLGFLADIFAVPSAVPLANVFSLGDIFVAAGLFILIQRSMIK